MPIDAAIPLQGRPVQIENPTQAAGQMVGLRNALMQGTSIQQQQQAQAMENMQRQQAMQDDQLMRQSYKEAGGDLNKAQQLMMEKGASPKAVTALQQQIAVAKEALAKLDGTTLENSVKRHDQLRGALQGFRALPSEQRAQGWKAFLDKAKNGGMLTDQEYQATLQQHPNAPNDDELTQYDHGLATATQLQKEAYQEQLAGARAATADAAQKRAEREGEQFSITKPALEAKSAEAVRANSSAALAAAAEQGKDAYMRAWSKLDPAAASAFPHPDEYDPKATIAAVRHLGMTPQQQVQTEESRRQHDQAAAHQKAVESQAARANDIRQQVANQHKDQAAKGLSTQQMERDAQQHDKLLTQEQEQWTLHGSLGDLLRLKEGEQYYDPTTKSGVPLTMDSAAKQKIKSMYATAETKAQQLSNQAKGIRQRQHWGEFAPGGQPEQPSTPPAAPKPTGQPTAAKYTEADVRARAKVAGIDEAAAVKAAKDAGLLK